MLLHVRFFTLINWSTPCSLADRLLPRYAVYALNAADSRKKIESFCATTAGNIGISATNLKTIEFLVPPKAEQKRIVSKVSVLLSQLDELSARLRCRQSTTDAVIHQILNGADER